MQITEKAAIPVKPINITLTSIIILNLQQQARLPRILINIFNLNRQMVAEIFKGIKEPGYHNFNWNAGNVRAGIYIIRIETEDFVAIRKCLLLK